MMLWVCRWGLEVLVGGWQTVHGVFWGQLIF
jgi:hypothetical protein